LVIILLLKTTHIFLQSGREASKQAAFAREEKKRGERDGCANLGFCLPAP
jgi:hypothetical protein